MRLSDYIEKNFYTEFKWGVNDCVLFAMSWVKDQIGVDHLKDLPTWKTEVEAKRVIVQVGGLEKAMDDRFTRINPNLARDGDIALCNGNLAIYSGRHVVGLGPTGLVFTDRMDVSCAWSLN